MSYQKIGGEVKIKSSDINRLYSASGITNYIEHKNKIQAIAKSKKAERIVSNTLSNAVYSANQIARANETHYRIEDEGVIAIDRILFRSEKSQHLKL